MTSLLNEHAMHTLRVYTITPLISPAHKTRAQDIDDDTISVGLAVGTQDTSIRHALLDTTKDLIAMEWHANHTVSPSHNISQSARDTSEDHDPARHANLSHTPQR